jgi:hypothetical protein
VSGWFYVERRPMIVLEWITIRSQRIETSRFYVSIHSKDEESNERARPIWFSLPQVI